MLRKCSLIITLVFIVLSCDLGHSDERIADELIRKRSEKILGRNGYNKLFTSASDSLISWQENGLYPEKDGATYYRLDSLICVNSSRTRLVGMKLNFYNGYIKDIYTEGIEEFLGAKVDGRWYFWTGGYKPVIRSAFKGHDPKQPLSYEQLHSQALKMMSGYVTEDGKINDKWFDYFFEGPGWGKFEEYHKDSITIGGVIIHNNKELLEYHYKRKGRGLWHRKAHDAYMKYKKEHGLE